MLANDGPAGAGLQMFIRETVEQFGGLEELEFWSHAHCFKPRLLGRVVASQDFLDFAPDAVDFGGLLSRVRHEANAFDLVFRPRY